MKPPTSSSSKISVKIAELPIRLGQFLKFAGIVENGLEAKSKIQNGEVSVNGLVELRRGRQIVHGDQVMIGEIAYRVESQD
jgi:ribosome-associated protein